MSFVFSLATYFMVRCHGKKYMKDRNQLVEVSREFLPWRRSSRLRWSKYKISREICVKERFIGLCGGKNSEIKMPGNIEGGELGGGMSQGKKPRGC